jgi:hypothetical protein
VLNGTIRRIGSSFKKYTITIENSGADKQKGLIPIWRLTLQKKDIIFCDGEVFFLDRGLLMGAKIKGQSISISIACILFPPKMQKGNPPI